MTYNPDYRENLADGVLKDLNIENLTKELEYYKKIASMWCPNISIDEDAMNGDAIRCTLTLITDNKPQGLSYTINKKEAIYLNDGDVLVTLIAEQLSLIFESKLRDELSWRLKKTMSNLQLQQRTKQ